MKKTVIVGSFLAFSFAVPILAFDFKDLIKEQKAVLKDIKKDVTGAPKTMKDIGKVRVNNEKASARARTDAVKRAPAEKKAELKSQANYIKKTPQRIKHEEKLRHRRFLNEQRQITANQKRKINQQRQRVLQLQNKPGAERDQAQRQYKQMLEAERRRVNNLKKK